MSKLKEIFLCTRPHTYPASFAPIFVGSSYSLRYGEFSFFNFLIFLFICLFIQAATNLFNEYYDYKLGLDKIDSVGISASIVKKKLTEKEVLYSALVLYFFALLLGIYLSVITSYYLILVGIVSMLVGYFYTGGKFPIAYSPFGELFAGFFMGTLIVLISFFIQVDYINFEVFLVSLPLFFLISSILLANNIRDIKNDKISGRRTLAILVGKDNAVNVLTVLISLSYILVFILFLLDICSIFIIVVYFTLPIAFKIISNFKKFNEKEFLAPYVIMSAKLTIIFGILSSIVCVFEYLLYF